MQRFRTTDGNRKSAVFLFNLFSHYHIFIVESLFTCRDVYFENLGKTTVLACELFTSGCRPWLKNVACLSSLMLDQARYPQICHFFFHIFCSCKTFLAIKRDHAANRKEQDRVPCVVNLCPKSTNCYVK